MPELENNNLPEFLTENEINFINKYREYVKNNTLKKPDDKFLIEARRKLDAITQEQIEKVRKDVLEYIEKNKSNCKLSKRYIQELTLPNYLRGYIARDHKNVAEKIVDAIEYLSELDDLNDEKFPREFLEFGLNAATGFDVYGNPVFYLFAQRNFIPKKLFEYTEKFMAYLVYQLVRISLHTNDFFTMVFDFTGASVANVDFNALRLLIKLIDNYSPACLNRILIYNLHWILKPAFKIGYQLLPANVGDMIHICTKEEIVKYIKKEQLSYMVEGGLNKEIILGRPKKNNTSFLEISDKVCNLSKEEARKLIEQFRKSLTKNNLQLISCD